MTPSSRALAATLAAALAACAGRDTVAAYRGGASCEGTLQPVLADGTCPGALAARIFDRAVCTCTGISLQGDLVTDGFDSRVAPWAPGGLGAGVGVQGGLQTTGRLLVGGGLVVSGTGLQGGSTLHVAGDLATGGPFVQAASSSTVDGSARIAGDVSVVSLTVGGTLTTPPGATLTGAIQAGSSVSGEVTVAPPCPCDAARGVDVAAVVTQGQTSNDDAAIDLAPGALSAVAGDAAIALPCGRFYLERIQGDGNVTIRAMGRAVLLVSGGVSLTGSLTIALDPGAELDLFVSGPFNLPATLRLGDPARPSALRLWLGAGGAIGVPAGAVLAANLYGPAVDLPLDGPFDLYGAVVLAHVTTSTSLSVHYDRAVGGAAATCGR